MGMLDDFTAVNAELLAVMGDDEQGTVARGGVVSPPITLFVDDALQDVGVHGRIVAGKRVVQAMNSDWVFARGDLVTVRGRSAKVDEVLSNDSIVNTAVLHG